MQTNVPTTSTVLQSLLRADLKTQWRNRRAVMLIIFVPVIILYAWRPLVEKIGAPFILGSCITVGLMATGLMGYTNSIAKDRDKGIFQRLRVAPLPSWTIMASRLLVQLLMIFIITSAVLIAGYALDNITIPAAGYALAFLASTVGAAVYLALGQLIVGLIKNPEIVNATTRLVYFVFIMVGMFGSTGALGETTEKYIIWTPYGTVQTIIAGAVVPSNWTNTTTEALFVTIGYAVVLFVIGIKNFKWSYK
jgi:ABC-2 type transport system permease protein